VHIGKVISRYKYQPNIEANYPHTRRVKWLKHVPRTEFSKAALYEIGSALSFFCVKNHADEFIYAVTGEAVKPSAREVEKIARYTRALIMRWMIEKFKGDLLVIFIAHMFETLGYVVSIPKDSKNGSVDILIHSSKATKDKLGFVTPTIKVQVIAIENSTDNSIAPTLYEKIGPNESGLLVSLGTFTPQAKNFAREKSNLRLVDGQELVTMILQHYEQFDSQYKGLLPLRRVYVPEILEELQESL
jgi:restriction system protein